MEHFANHLLTKLKDLISTYITNFVCHLFLQFRYFFYKKKLNIQNKYHHIHIVLKHK